MNDLDRTLAALNDVQPPSGLQQRILASLHQHESRARRRWPLLLTASLASAAILAAFSLFTHRVPHRREAKVGVAPTSSIELSSFAAGGGPASVLAHSSGAPSQPALSADVGTHIAPPTHEVILDEVQNPASCLSVCANSSPESALASFPAPPAPLTEQEKLLLRIADHPTPEEFSLLNPETIEREIAQNDLEFNQFFPTPAPIVQPIPQESTDELQPSQR